MKDNAPRHSNGYEIALGKLAVYPEQGVRPVVEVFPAGNTSPFTARIISRAKSRQEGNPMFNAVVLGTPDGTPKDVVLGAGTAVRPIKVFERK